MKKIFRIAVLSFALIAFMASANTISSAMKRKFPNIWTLQLEINCDITNKKENFQKYKKILVILEKWIKKLN